MKKINKKNSNEIYELEGVYGDQSKFTSSNRLNKIINLILRLDKKPKNILDVGCGTGYLSNELKKMFPMAEVIAIDISQNAISIAKKQYSNIIFKTADAENILPFKNAQFDLVMSG